MNEDLYRQQAQRARDLAERADPFTRKRLLDLAERYDARGGSPSRTYKMTPVSRYERSGEA